jgi:protoporphyrinogen oxidase
MKSVDQEQEQYRREQQESHDEYEQFARRTYGDEFYENMVKRVQDRRAGIAPDDCRKEA